MLRDLGLNFKVVPSNVDESKINEENPTDHVRKLAMLKAASVAKGMREHMLVIGADTVVSIDSEILGKPRGKKHAREMLQKLSGREHRVYTGICIINTETENVYADVQKTKVRFRELTQKEIDRNVSNDDVTDWAGAYKLQDQPWLVQSIEGSLTNVIGLPTEKFIPLMRENGVDI